MYTCEYNYKQCPTLILQTDDKQQEEPINILKPELIGGVWV